MSETLQPTEILAELARRRWPKYMFAARVGVHPATLAKMLAERRPIPPEVSARMQAVLEETRPA